MTTIEIEGMGFSYDEEHPVLSGIDLILDRPGLYCIIGPNGVGKSTLVKCMNKILEPTEGRVLIDGQDISELKYRDVAKLIGYVPTSSEDTFAMPVVDAIMIGRYNHQRWGSKEDDLRAVYRAMKLLHIRDIADRSCLELSAGQHQKVSIARGLVQETPVLVLDEPTSNLDVNYQVYVAELLRAVSERSGMIVVMICHDLNIAAKYAHTIIMMQRPGTIYKVGPPSEVITEGNIEDLYGIGCRVMDIDGVPHVILGSSSIEDDEWVERAGMMRDDVLARIRRVVKRHRWN